MTDDEPLLSVRNLSTHFETDAGTLRAVDGIDFDVKEGETVCLVGESGSGKTVASESITRIIQSGRVDYDGEIEFRGETISEMSEKQLRNIRGGDIAHIFQNPQDALNHCYTIGWQIVEAIQSHEDVPKKEARERAIDMLDRVGIPDAADRIDDYPHEFSGGMTQRAMIAMALVTKPDLLIADEPTTALDVTIQAQILRLLNDLQEEFGMSMLFITHDLGVVAEIADRVVVMYAGKVMEKGDVYEIFESPKHPYTQALLQCLPGRGAKTGGIPGSLPDPTNPGDGCRFSDRCDHAVDECHVGDQPPLLPTDSRDHVASCVYYQDGYDESTLEMEETSDSTEYEKGMNDD